MLLSAVAKRLLALLGILHVACPTTASAPARNVRISGQGWIDATTGAPVLLKGPNVVVKGPPWLPRVEGDSVCNDTSTTTCTTFNEADAQHITQTMGWNSIRLGVTWAGAQPTVADELDPTWVSNLHEILNLTDRYKIHVVLDMHTDMVGSADCGFGVPMWLSQKAAPDLIGKPLTPAFPFDDLGMFTDMFKLHLPAGCGVDNASAWEEHMGDPNYNLLNKCCIGLNAGANNNALGFTKLSQATLGYLFKKGPGRDIFARYYGLLAAAVAEHPSAVAIEPMNEPMYIQRWDMFETWKAINDAVTAVVPDMSVAVVDTGEGAVLPHWLSWVDAGIGIWPSTVKWLQETPNLFYAWHVSTAQQQITVPPAVQKNSRSFCPCLPTFPPSLPRHTLCRSCFAFLPLTGRLNLLVSQLSSVVRQSQRPGRCRQERGGNHVEVEHRRHADRDDELLGT